MERCKDCIFWGDYDDAGETGQSLARFDRDVDGLKSCGAVVYCAPDGYGFADSEENPKIIVESDEGWGMRTSADFGCVLFQPREGQ